MGSVRDKISKRRIERSSILGMSIIFLLLFSTVVSSDLGNVVIKEQKDEKNVYLNNAEDKLKSALTPFSKNFANLTGHAWDVRRVEFSPNGELLASSSSDGSIRLWDIETGDTIRILQNHYYDVASIAFSPDSKLLASGGWGKKINLWDVSTGNLLKTWSIHPHVALDLAFSPDGNSLAVGSADYQGYWTILQELPLENSYLRIINITNGEILHNFEGHTNPVTSVKFSSDGLDLYSSSWDKTIKKWNVLTGSEVYSFSNHSEVITSIDISPDGTKLVSGSFDKTIQIWDIVSESLLDILEGPDMEVWSVVFTGGNDLVAAAVGNKSSVQKPKEFWQDAGGKVDSSIQIWNIQNGELEEVLVGHDHLIESISVSSDGTMLASGSWDWTIKLWGDYPIIMPDQPIDQWEVSSPEEQGLNSTMLKEIGESPGSGIHSILVVRNKKLVFEKYYNDPTHNYIAENKHVLFSATKSFTSALVGIAIDKGFIQSVDQKVLDFFPEYDFDNVDSRKEEMTLKHLLTMTSGLTWSETPYLDYISEMYFSNDSVQYVLDKTMFSNPGTYYFYNSGGSHLLSAIIHQTTGQSTLEFAIENLFEPIGIERNDVIWMSDTQGSAFGGIGLFLTPRNMAKFGQLYLNEGKWNEEQIIPKDWINESTTNQIGHIGYFRGTHSMDGYGYQWWTSSSLNGFTALGYMGKFIFVLPEEEIVVVFTSFVDPSVIFNVVDKIINTILPETNRTDFFHLSLIFPFILIITILQKRVGKKEKWKEEFYS
ncbi:MAG: serine hydrolase [Asgard group archaeon]|nr:serine hydrolase [Asgard group archaeon]